MQDSLSSLSLTPIKKGQKDVTDSTLIGKLLSTRAFRRFTVSEIIGKMWRLETKIFIEKIEENTFKFNFGSKRDKEKIFNNRPWTVNGALLILKEWDAHTALHNISFNTSTFILQVNGLP